MYSICCDDSTHDNLLNKYSIKEFPTTIVFSPDGTAQSTVIGASYEMIEGLIRVQAQLVKGQSKIVTMVICFLFHRIAIVAVLLNKLNLKKVLKWTVSVVETPV